MKYHVTVWVCDNYIAHGGYYKSVDTTVYPPTLVKDHNLNKMREPLHKHWVLIGFWPWNQ